MSKLVNSPFKNTLVGFKEIMGLYILLLTFVVLKPVLKLLTTFNYLGTEMQDAVVTAIEMGYRFYKKKKIINISRFLQNSFIKGGW